jgi:sec-independent protein translocase protein TatA
MNIGPLEIVLIVIVVLLVFGGRRIPDAGRWLGSGVRSFVDSVRGIHPEDEAQAEPAKLEAPEPEDAVTDVSSTAEQKPS